MSGTAVKECKGKNKKQCRKNTVMHDRIAKNRLNIMFSQNTQWKNKKTKTKDTKKKNLSLVITKIMPYPISQVSEDCKFGIRSASQ